MRDRIGLGQQLFWFCRTELHQKETAQKYNLLLATYLRATEEHVQILLAQHELVAKLVAMCNSIKEEGSGAKRLKRMNDALTSLSFVAPSRQLPLLPTISIKNPILDKCKIMDSAKAPVWAVFEYLIHANLL